GDLGEHLVVPAGGREQAVVARVPRQGRAQGRRHAAAEQVGDAGRLDRRLRRAERREAEGAGRDVDVLELVGQERVGLVRQRTAPRQIAAGRVAGEAAEAARLVVEVERERPLRVEQVRLDEAEQEQLAQARDLRLQREGLAAAEQVVLRDLRLRDEV